MRVAVLVVPRGEGVSKRHRLADPHLLSELPALGVRVRLRNLGFRAAQGVRHHLGASVLFAPSGCAAAHHTALERRTVSPAPTIRHPHSLRRRRNDVLVSRHRPDDVENLLQKSVDREQRSWAPLVVAPEIQPVACELRIRCVRLRFSRARRLSSQDNRKFRFPLCR